MTFAQSYIVDVIEGRKKGAWVKGALWAASGLFEMGVRLRNLAFDRQWLKVKRIDIPVVSIGNIIAGGAGKTAFIRRLTKDLQGLGKVSVLTRGYRSEIEKVGGSLHLIEQSRITPDVCGDEAYLLFKSLPDAAVFVGKDRALNGERAVYHEADVALLDDGMQCRSLHRDLEIVILHGDDLYGKGFFLPRGYLRDSPKRLEEADLIVINHVRDLDHFEEGKKEVRRWSKAPLIGTRMVPECVELATGEQLRDLKDRRVGIFCGLGKPESFFQTAQELGGEQREKWILPDHIGPTEKELKRFAEKCEERGCDLLVCSEKDWVKLPSLDQISLPIGRVKAELKVEIGHEAYADLIGNIETLFPQRRAG